MLLFKLTVYTLFAYGLANMVVYANGPFGIFEKWRDLSHRISAGFGELFTCMICFSTWIGVVFSLLNSFVVTSVAFTPFSVVFGAGHNDVVIKTFMDMCATSGAVWLLHNFEEACERHWANFSEVEDEGDIKADIIEY